jgi:DNA-binding NarL/FixJ family response regulator
MGQRAEVVLGDAEREVLERWARRPKSSQALALRCRIVLAAGAGERNKDIAARLGCDRNTVGKWRRRLPSEVWMGCTTSRARANHARSATMTSSG